jgi:hypothetical protein
MEFLPEFLCSWRGGSGRRPRASWQPLLKHGFGASKSGTILRKAWVETYPRPSCKGISSRDIPTSTLDPSTKKQFQSTFFFFLCHSLFLFSVVTRYIALPSKYCKAGNIGSGAFIDMMWIMDNWWEVNFIEVFVVGVRLNLPIEIWKWISSPTVSVGSLSLDGAMM